jgi:peptide/nickel transport system substrate-binding protein
VGPFKLVEWELGSQVLLEAYDGYFLGRPKIDRLTIKFIPNIDTIVANILAGTVDWTSDLKFEQSTAIKRQWEAAGLKPTAILDISALRYVWIQYRDPAFRGLLDARVRRGLLSALDRQALSDGLFEGLAPVADTFIPPDDVRWDWFRDVALTYPHDERRAEQLFAEAGLRRESDRVFADMNGTRMVLSQWTNDGPPGPQEIAITADQWRAFGVPTEQTILAPSQQQDRRLRASFPALFHNSWSRPNWVNIDGRLDSANCANESNQWNGLNQGCYVNPSADQILGRLKGAFDPEAQRPLYRDLMRLYTEELPLLPLYFSSNIILARQGLTGLKGKANPEGGTTWNIGDWDVD